MDDTTQDHKNVRDLRGLKFGRLLVLERDRAPGLKLVRWLVRCECGVEKSVAAAKMVHGNTVSCGCQRAEQRISYNLSRHDFAGQTLGRLTVMERVHVKAGMRWRCACSCGGEKIATTLYLKTSTEPSCGCAMSESAAARRFLDLVGKVFGKLTAVEHVGFTPARKAKWRCSCSCGGEHVAIGNSLTNGRTISCGCAAKDDIVYMPSKARAESAAKCARRRALKLAAGGSFTPEQIEDLFHKQRGWCACCKVKKLGTTFHRDHKTPLTRGGSNDILNIELLCAKCNQKKNDMDPIEWANKRGLLC